MKYAILLTALGLLQCASAFVLAPRMGGFSCLAGWSGLSWFLVGCAYAGQDSRVFGKRGDGTMSRGNVAVLLPYLAAVWLLWHVQRLLSRAPVHQEIAPGLWLGRRCSARKLPLGTAVVVDLTSEFCELPSVRADRTYLCLPILDAAAPPDAAFRGLVQTVTNAARERRPVYIHCAKGYGRSATVMAAVLVATGNAASLEEAEAQMQAARPGVKINRVQRSVLERWNGTQQA